MLPLVALVVGCATVCWAGAGPAARRAAVMQVVERVQAGRPDQAQALLRDLLAGDQSPAVDHQAMGALFLMQGDLDSAEVHYRRALGLDSLLAEAWHGVGLVRAARGDHAGADEAYRVALDLDAGQPAFHYNAGLGLERRGQLNEAGRCFEAAVRIYPDNADARRRLGAVLLRLERAREALPQCAAACRLAPRSPANWLALADVYAALQEDSLAGQARQRAAAAGVRPAARSRGTASTGRQAAGAGNSALAAVPGPAGAPASSALPLGLALPALDLASGQVELAALYSRSGRQAEAGARLQRAADLGLELAGAAPAGDVQARAAVETRAAREAMDEHDYRLAVSRYGAAARLQPRSARIQRNLGLALASCGRAPAALAAYRRALELDAGLAPAHNDLGVVYSQSFEEHQQAIECLRRAVALEPAAKLYRFNLAQVYLGISQWDAAAAELERVVELDPRSALALFSLGVALARQAQPGAADRLQQALALNPEYADAWYELGRLQMTAGRADQAAAAYQRCLAVQPDHKYAHYGLGQAYTKLGRPAEGKAELEHFAALPAHPRIRQFIFFAPPDSL